MFYILITGATGFLGSHILKTLLQKTDYNILILKRSFSNTYRISEELTNDKIKYIDIDVDKSGLLKFFENENIVAIIHCATNYGRNCDCANTLETNLIFPVYLLELAVKYGTELFINTDSYFNKDSMSYLYLQNYSLSKKSLLLWLKYFSKKIKIINMVLEHIYGDMDGENKFVTSMISKIAINKVKSVDCTYGDQKRDFIFVDDVCNAYLKVFEFALNNKFRYKSFDVGTGKAVPVKDFIRKIKDISGSSTEIRFGALPYRDDEIMLSEADNIDLCNLGWTPKFDYVSGIKLTIERWQNEIINNCNTNLQQNRGVQKNCRKYSRAD